MEHQSRPWLTLQQQQVWLGMRLQCLALKFHGNANLCGLDSRCRRKDQCPVAGEKGHPACRCASDSLGKYCLMISVISWANFFSQTDSPGAKSDEAGDGTGKDVYVTDGDYIKDIEINDLRNRYTLTKGSTQQMVNYSYCQLADLPDMPFSRGQAVCFALEPDPL
jgi:hypothetical protein